MVVADVKSHKYMLIYQHKDKSVGENGYSHDGKYIIVAYTRMKDPTTRKWVDGVMYRDISTLNTYVREEQDFFNTFEELVDLV